MGDSQVITMYVLIGHGELKSSSSLWLNLVCSNVREYLIVAVAILCLVRSIRIVGIVGIL